MSHFVVLVIGEDVEKQLAPYHEFECTGEDNEFVQDIDQTEELRKEFAANKDSDYATFLDFCVDYYGHKLVPFGTEPEKDGEHKYGYTLVDEKGEVVKTVNRTNPNKKWDWYAIGGRWTGFFKLKPSKRGKLGKPGLQRMDKDYQPPSAEQADSCFKGDVDIDSMKFDAAAKAYADYDLFTSVTKGLPKPLSWEAIRAKHTGNIEAARKEYHNQPLIKALSKNEDTSWFEAEHFDMGREEYAQRARDGAMVTFALVKDGQWYERGEMGWWGSVSGEKDRGEWQKQFSALLDGLPDDTMLTAVDCHI